MRTQKIITIDTECGGRNKYEPLTEYHNRMDDQLATRIQQKQLTLGDEWYLLSVVPAGSNFIPGVYLTTWEYDDSDEDVALDSTDEVEAFSKHPEGFIKKLTGNMEYGQSDDKDVAEDGDTSPHVQFGEKIRVNGVGFILAEFQRDGGGASVGFIEEDEYRRYMEPRAEAHFVLHNTERGNNRQFQGVEMPRRPGFVTYNQPRGYRGR